MISAEGIKSLGISFDELTPAYKAGPRLQAKFRQMLICLSTPFHSISPALQCEESMRAVYGTVGSFQSVKDQIHCSRGITMGSTQTRKVPNAFRFCRQLEVLKRAGSEAESFDVFWLPLLRKTTNTVGLLCLLCFPHLSWPFLSYLQA